MAIENKVILNGQIRAIRKIRDESKNVTKIYIGLMVVRRPDNAKGNERRDVKTDMVTVIICDQDIIRYICTEKAAEGDMLEVFGVFCTVRGKKSFYCKECGKKNEYEGVVSYVHPLCTHLYALKPKNVETVLLTRLERDGTNKEVIENIKKKKTYPGKLIEIKDLGFQGDYDHVRIVVQEPLPNDEVIQWLQRMDEISNRAFLIGNLCNDPTYNPKENGGRICSYQIGINRKVYIDEDDPASKADFPWIKSLGDQADKDNIALAMGSQVYIDGSIQARDGFKVEKECEFCGEINSVNDTAMEIVPYYVEYLRNCMVDDILQEEEEDEPYPGDEFCFSSPEDNDGDDDRSDDWYGEGGDE